MEHLHTILILLFLFCSPSVGTTFLTHLGTQCKEDCKPDGGEYMCKTIDEDGRSQILYCSPQENMDYWGRQCRADSTCGKHGEDYYWCRINVFTWGYCGLVKDDKIIIESGDVTHITSQHRNKRQIQFYSERDQNNRLITFFEEPAAILNGRQWRDDAEDLINQWNNGRLGNQARSNLIKSKTLRIDLQNTFTKNNQMYFNLQIQINVKRPPHTSTTISQIIVPNGTSEDHIRRAFRESLARQARVRVEIGVAK